MVPIVFELSESDQLANHIPEDCWQLSREHEVFVRDGKTGEFVQVCHCQHLGAEIGGEDE